MGKAEVQYDQAKNMYYHFESGCCGTTMHRKTLINGKPLEHEYRWYVNQKGTALRKGMKDTQLHYCDACGEKCRIVVITHPKEAAITKDNKED